MLRSMLLAKIHMATITDTNLYYEGSIEIDAKLLEKSGILPGECVQVLNFANGNRFETYVIAGKENSGIIGLRGPAAKLGKVGDKLIIAAYVLASPEESKKIKPKVIYLDENNKIKT